MRNFRHYRQIFAYLPSLVIIAMLLFPPAAKSQDEKLSANEEERLSPAVEQLKRVLQSSDFDPKNLQEAANRLKGVRDLRLALLLPDWREETRGVLPTSVPGIVVPGSVVVQAVHQQVEARLVRIVLDGLRSQDSNRQIASATLLAEIGAQIPSTRSPQGFASTFAPELVEFLKNKNPAVVESAARALGQINTDPSVASSALGRVLETGQNPEKQAAAAALVAQIQNINRLKTVPDPTGKILGKKEASDEDRLRVAQSVARTAGRGLTDPDARVRRQCADAIRLAGATLQDIVPVSFGDSTQISAERLRLAKALENQGRALAGLLMDSDSETRLMAAEALTQMARARFQSARWGAGTPSPVPTKEKGGAAPESTPEESLLNGLRAALPALSETVADADVRMRLTAVTVLDLMGEEAAPAADALDHALRDADIFVRWAAARALGNLKAADGKVAVPNLGRLLFDPDLDPRLAAAATLEHYGKDAAAAVPDLIRATSVGDAEIRVAVIHALEAVGAEEARSAVPALAQALSDRDDRVRQAAAEVLGSFGPVAQNAEPALRRALDDKEATVRKAASSALLNLKGE